MIGGGRCETAEVRAGSAGLMPVKSDREILVDSPPPRDRHGLSESLPGSGRGETPSSRLCGLLNSWFCGDQTTSKQLSLIYTSIAACFAAVTVALVITIFVGQPQVSAFME